MAVAAPSLPFKAAVLSLCLLSIANCYRREVIVEGKWPRSRRLLTFVVAGSVGVVGRCMGRKAHIYIYTLLVFIAMSSCGGGCCCLLFFVVIFCCYLLFFVVVLLLLVICCCCCCCCACCCCLLLLVVCRCCCCCFCTAAVMVIVVPSADAGNGRTQGPVPCTSLLLLIL